MPMFTELLQQSELQRSFHITVTETVGSPAEEPLAVEVAGLLPVVHSSDHNKLFWGFSGLYDIFRKIKIHDLK